MKNWIKGSVLCACVGGAIGFVILGGPHGAVIGAKVGVAAAGGGST